MSNTPQKFRISDFWNPKNDLHPSLKEGKASGEDRRPGKGLRPSLTISKGTAENHEHSKLKSWIIKGLVAAGILGAGVVGVKSCDDDSNPTAPDITPATQPMPDHVETSDKPLKPEMHITSVRVVPREEAEKKRKAPAQKNASPSRDKPLPAAAHEEGNKDTPPSGTWQKNVSTRNTDPAEMNK